MKCTTVIASFNRRHCIDEAINSALRELPGHEIVVVDDASTDDTPSFLRQRFGSEIARGDLSLCCLEKNIGVSGAKNTGYERANGDWVIFLDSDDLFETGAGPLMEKELNRSSECPIVFFRCRTQVGTFVGSKEGEELQLDLGTYLRNTSFGEALTAINKRKTGSSPPYVQFLRGYEGIGCARLIRQFGHARLSSTVARIYVTNGEDRLSAKRALFSRMHLIAAGHLIMIREFWRFMGVQRTVALLIKAALYLMLGAAYRLAAKK